MQARSRSQCCCRKAIHITFSEYVFVALVIRHASRIFLRPIILPSGSIVFSHTMSQTARCLEKNIEHKTCVLIFSTTFAWKFFILRRNKRDIIKVHRSSCEVPFILVRFWWKLSFLDRFYRNTQILNLMNTRPVGWPSFFVRKDGQTDLTELIVAFPSFANTPINYSPFLQNWHCACWKCPTPYRSNRKAAPITSNVNQSFRLLTVRSGRSQTQH
jgi:hypothetical protein